MTSPFKTHGVVADSWSLGFDEWMLVWVPVRAGGDGTEVAVVRWPGDGTKRWPREHSAGCCDADRFSPRIPHWQRVALMFAEFHALVIRDGMDPQAVHRAFLRIDEYRRRISPDVEGAEIS